MNKIEVGYSQLEKMWRDEEGKVIVDGVEHVFTMNDEEDEDYWHERGDKYHYLKVRFTRESDGTLWFIEFQGKGYDGDLDWAPMDSFLTQEANA